MFFNDNLWTIAFVLTTAMVTAATIMFWVGIREFVMHRNWRSLLFGAGIISVSFGYLAMNLYNMPVLPWHIVIPFNLGFSLIGIALIKGKWQYAFAIFALVPFLILLNSPYFPLVALPILVVAWLAYKNFCILSCREEECVRKQRENIEWAIIFGLFFCSLLLQIVARGGYYSFVGDYVIYLTIVLRMAIVALLFWHILKCMRFSARERTLFPIVVGFVIILVSMGFFINRSIVSYVENNLKTQVLSETKAAKSLSEKECLTENQLAGRIEKRDIKLNDLADQILARTGIRMSFFAGNERIAASSSADGKGRYLGTKIEDPKIKAAVLERGEEYAGKIEKGNEVAMAAYVPIFDGDKIVGMVGSGRFVTDFYNLQRELFYQVTAGIGAVFMVLMVTVFYGLPKLSKKLKPKS